MNCRFCGYYVSRGMKICGHCGNDPDGLKKTRLMTISKIIAVIAVIVPIITIIFNSDWKYEFLTSSLILLPLAILLFVDERDVFMCAVPCILLTISAITAKIDKQNQKIKNKKQEMKK